MPIRDCGGTLKISGIVCGTPKYKKPSKSNMMQKKNEVISNTIS